MRKVLGRYIVMDTEICHGELTFRGTRIFVKDVLEQVAEGMAWDSIVESWRGDVKKAAIAEAIRLAREALIEHKHGVAAATPD
jgi:uncharacterized protein (DUF433 family)